MFLKKYALVDDTVSESLTDANTILSVKFEILNPITVLCAFDDVVSTSVSDVPIPVFNTFLNSVAIFYPNNNAELIPISVAFKNVIPAPEIQSEPL